MTRRRKRQSSNTHYLIQRMTATSIILVVGVVIVGIYGLSWAGDNARFTESMRREELAQKRIETQDQLNAAQEAQKRRENWTQFQEDITPVFYFIVIGVAGVGVLYFFSMVQSSQIDNDKKRRSRNEDGSWPLVEIDERTMLDPNTDTFYSWDGRKWIAQVSQFTPQKLFMDHQRQMYRSRDGSNRMTSQERKLIESMPNPADLVIESYVDDNELLQIEASAHQPDTVDEFFDIAEIDAIPIGYAKEGKSVLEIDVTRKPHMIIAGQTDHGKSWLTLLLSGMLNNCGIHLTVFDCMKQLADYKPIVKNGSIDGYAIDEVGLEYVADCIVAFGRYRQSLLNDIDAKDINHYNAITDRPMVRYAFVIDELGALGLSVKGDAARQETFDVAMTKLAGAIGWVRQVGLHLVLSTQFVNTKLFPQDLRMNINSLVFNYPTTGFKSLNCSPVVQSLGKGEFVCLGQPRNDNNLDAVYVTPWSKTDEFSIYDRFEPMTNSNMFDILGAEGPPKPGFNEFEAKKTVQKMGLTGLHSDKPVLSNRLQTDSNSFQTDNKPVSNSFQTGFKLTNLDWQNIRNMKPASKRQAYLRDNFPKIDGPIETDEHIDYLAEAYNCLDGKKTDICFLLYGRKDGDTWEWLNDAIDDYLDIE